MESHKEATQGPDRTRPDVLSRLRQRGRLCEIVSKRRHESNNYQRGHPLLDQDIEKNERNTPTLAIPGATLTPEPEHYSQRQDRTK